MSVTEEGCLAGLTEHQSRTVAAWMLPQFITIDKAFAKVDDVKFVGEGRGDYDVVQESSWWRRQGSGMLWLLQE